MALASQCWPPEITFDLLQRTPANLAVVDVDHDIVVFGNDECRVVETVLIRSDPDPVAEVYHPPVNQFSGRFEAQTLHLIDHYIHPEARNQNFG